MVLLDSNKLYQYKYNFQTEDFDLLKLYTQFNENNIKFRDFDLLQSIQQDIKQILFSCGKENGLYLYSINKREMKQYKKTKDKNKNNKLKKWLKIKCKDRKIYIVNKINSNKKLICGYCKTAKVCFIPEVIQGIILLYLYQNLFSLNIYNAEYKAYGDNLTASNTSLITAELHIEAFE